MTAIWHWVRSLFRRSDPDTDAPIRFEPRRDRDIRWFQRQRHQSEQATKRLQTISDDLFPDHRRKDAS